MTADLRALVDSSAPPQRTCKCCGGAALLFGMVDFNKNCEERRGLRLPPTGVPIPYHRCTRCGFVFTAALDRFSRQDFLDHIYNGEYLKVDPDYIEHRPLATAQGFAAAFARQRDICVLDYGGGNGRCAQALRSAGLTDVATYDPFVPQFAARPARQFDCILCTEVLEHSDRPVDTFKDMISFLRPDGLILFSTLLQPPDIATRGVTWWYLAPRNGHISLFTHAALEAILRPLGFNCRSLAPSIHLAWSRVPAFAAHLITPQRA